MKESYIQDFQAWQEEFTFSQDIAVRFSETDMFGHLNNTVPFIYFEQARIAMMEEVNIMGATLTADSPTIPVVADLQCDFLGQVYFGDTVKMHVKFAKVGGSSADIHYMGTVRDQVVLTGRGALVQIDSKTGKSVKWTEEQLQLVR